MASNGLSWMMSWNTIKKINVIIIVKAFWLSLNNFMKNNKIIIIVYVLLCSICVEAKIEDSNKSCEDVHDIYPIAKSVEPNSGYRNLLGKYISLSMRANDCDELNGDSLKILFVRPSFEQSLLYLCTPENYSTSNIYYEDDSRWKESLPYLISNCTNKDVQYEIADELLGQGLDVGLIALWNSCDIGKLQNYDSYIGKLVSEQNYYLLGDIAIIAHNAKKEKECGKLLRMIKKHHKPFWQFLKRYIGKNECLSFYYYHSILNEEFFIDITP